MRLSDVDRALRAVTAKSTTDSADRLESTNNYMGAITEINAKFLNIIAVHSGAILTATSLIAVNTTAILAAIQSFLGELGKKSGTVKTAAFMADQRLKSFDPAKHGASILEANDKATAGIEAIQDKANGLTKGLKGTNKATGKFSKILGKTNPKMILLAFAAKLLSNFITGLLSSIEPLLDLMTAFGELLGTGLTPIVMGLFKALVPLLPVLVRILDLFTPLITVVALLLESFAPLIVAVVELTIVFSPFIRTLIMITPLLVNVGVILSIMITIVGSLASLLSGSLFIVLESITDKWNELTRVTDVLNSGFSTMEEMVEKVNKKLKQFKDWVDSLI